jgi:transposase
VGAEVGLIHLGTVVDEASPVGRAEVNRSRGPGKEKSMAERRIVGIDLGIASAHTVVVLTGEGTEVCRRKCVPTAESLGWIEQQALAGAPEGTQLEIVLEPTGPAWLAPVVFFGRRGHACYRVSSEKASDLRKFLSRHAKSNSIDALTLARLAVVAAETLRPVELPGADRATLDRRVRACDRLTREAAEHKVRIKDLVRQLMPMTPLTGDLGKADLAVLERWADPNALLKAGKARLTGVIVKASNNHLGADRAGEWIAAARSSVELYGCDSAVPFSDLAAEVATEVRLLRAIQAELDDHAEVREAAYLAVDTWELARSLPGLAEIGAPVLVAVMGRPQRFARAEQFKSFTGSCPGPLRQGTPSARASRCRRPDRRCSARSSCARRTPRGSSTRSWRRSTSPRWWSGGPPTPRRCASWPRASPSGPGR